MSKSILQNKLGRPVQQVAMLDGANLYLLASSDPQADSDRLSREPYVLYAQPDIKQTRNHQGYPFAIKQTIAGSPAEWPQNLGKGVRIAIIDDGFNLEHEDLQGADIGFSYDADLKILNAIPKSEIDRHGTQVAGIIFAQHNTKGIDGIAPKATLIPIRQTSTRTSDTVLSFTVAALAGAEIINCSWNSPVLMQPVHDVIEHLARQGRAGLGMAIFFAAGNEGKTLQHGSQEAAMDSVIAVGSTHQGQIATYSNHGKTIDMYLPGYLRTTKNQGYGPFKGTSASSALASGLAALLLADKPQLTLRELRRALSTWTAQTWPRQADTATATNQDS